MTDILVVCWDVTSDVASTIGDKLHKIGYTVNLVHGTENGGARVNDRATVVLPVVAGNVSSGLKCDCDLIVTVWPNNCPRPVGEVADYSTLDMVGTDFELSFKKICQRFPAALREKAATIEKLVSDGMWVEFLSAHPDLSDLCPFESLSGYQWAELLAAHPEYSGRCNWDKLHGGHWLLLLRTNPEYVEHCRWEMLSDDDLKDLLAVRPELSSCVKDRSHVISHYDSSIPCLSEVSENGTSHALSSSDEAGNSDEDDDSNLIYDVYVSSAPRGRDAASRLASALETRGYSVFSDNGTGSVEENCAAIETARYYILIRSEGVFDDLLNRGSELAKRVAYAMRCGKRIISVGPMDQKWQDSRSLPEEFCTLETDQVKPLDMGDLFEEKVDALIRESMRSIRGSLARKYDVFISYRRSTGDRVARRMQQLLRDQGFLSFLDYDCILNGKYDKVIRSALDSAPVFIPLFTEGSLDRCKNPGDWVAEEIRMAIAAGKCIIPVAPNNQQWSIPQDLPDSLNAIRGMPVSLLSMESGHAEDSIKRIVGSFPSEVMRKGELIRDIRERGGCQNEDNCILEEDGVVPEIQVSPDGKKVFNSELSGLLWRYPDAISLFPYRDFDAQTWRSILEDVPELRSYCP